MSPERRKLVRGIVDRARSLDPVRRARFIAEETAGDEDLRRAVEAALGTESRDLADAFPDGAQGADSLPVSTMARGTPAALLRICMKCRSRYGPAVRVCPADGEVLVEDPAALVGETLDGLYQIEGLLGKGAMGTVYLARHTLLQDRVAIKVLASHLSANPEFLKRFLREGRAARAIHHPNAMTVHELRTTSDGLAYMVLEYIEGRNLREELTERRAFPLSEALDLVAKLASALDDAHEQGVVHRDIKPENVMLGSVRGKPAVKLLDLGIAKHSPVLDSGLGVQTAITVVGGVVGTPQYMSPEQWGDPQPDGVAEIDGRADVYSLAVMLFEFVAGFRPFEGATLSDIRLAHVSGPVPRLDAVLPTVPSSVGEAIARGMAKDRRDRQSTCGQLVAEVRSALAASPAGAELDVATIIADASAFNPPPSVAPIEQDIATIIADASVASPGPPAPVETSTPVADTIVSGETVVIPPPAATPQFSAPAAETVVTDARLGRTPPGPPPAPAEHEILTIVSDSRLDESPSSAPAAPAQHEIATIVSHAQVDDPAQTAPPTEIVAAPPVAPSAGASEREKPDVAPGTGADVASPDARLKVALIAAVLVVGALSTAYAFWPRAEAPPAPSLASTSTAQPERSFSYSVTAQKFKNGKKYKEPLDVSSGFPFTSEDKIWITVTSGEAGYLYAIGEGSTPEPLSGETPLRVLFPDPMVAGGSPAVAPGAAVRIPPDGVPPIDFDDTRGKEKLWIIWAAEPIPDLDGIAGLLNERDKGLVTKSKFDRSVKELLARPQATSTDDESKKTIVRGKGQVLVALRELEHY